MSSPLGDGIGEMQKSSLDLELRSIQCSRSVWNRAAIIYHLALKQLEPGLDSKLLFAACMSYSLKECCESTSLPALTALRKSINEVDAAALEVILLEYVRPHVVLIESCMRLQLKILTLHTTIPHNDRESVARVALALAQELYTCSFCLFPESCARACLLAACVLLNTPIESATLPSSFVSPLVSEVKRHLLSLHNANGD